MPRPSGQKRAAIDTSSSPVSPTQYFLTELGLDYEWQNSLLRVGDMNELFLDNNFNDFLPNFSASGEVDFGDNVEREDSVQIYRHITIPIEREDAAVSLAMSSVSSLGPYCHAKGPVRLQLSKPPLGSDPFALFFESLQQIRPDLFNAGDYSRTRMLAKTLEVLRLANEDSQELRRLRQENKRLRAELNS